MAGDGVGSGQLPGTAYVPECSLEEEGVRRNRIGRNKPREGGKGTA